LSPFPESLAAGSRQVSRGITRHADAPAIQKTARAREIADAMIAITHPYPVGEAERYILRRRAEREEGRSAIFVVKLRAEARFCALIEIRDVDREHSQGELSFWLTIEVWRKAT
jgi:ribosomal-protein-alanine N-acetyltransferase